MAPDELDAIRTEPLRLLPPITLALPSIPPLVDHLRLSCLHLLLVLAVLPSPISEGEVLTTVVEDTTLTSGEIPLQPVAGTGAHCIAADLPLSGAL